jgi:hypothetical protein
MISGKSFSELCKWVVDPRYPDRGSFHYILARHGDWVYVNGNCLDDFFRRIPNLSSKRFVVVVHNTDRPFGQTEMTALFPYALRIYAINTTIQHPMLTTIPLGFVDRQLPFLRGFKTGSSERPHEIYMNFTAGTNTPKRKECMDAFEGDARVVRGENLSMSEYYMDLCRSKFVLCPEGTGMDTHRVYESLYCGATPVVLRNSLSHLYEKLPVCIVDSWTDPLFVPIGKNFDVSVHKYL